MKLILAGRRFGLLIFRLWPLGFNESAQFLQSFTAQRISEDFPKVKKSAENHQQNPYSSNSTMSGANDKARFYLEQGVPQLQELEQKKIFTKVSLSISASYMSFLSYAIVY